MKSKYYCPFCSTILKRNVSKDAFIGECHGCKEKFYILVLTRIDSVNLGSIDKVKKDKDKSKDK